MLWGQNCKFFKTPLTCNSRKRLEHKENQIKCIKMTREPRHHVRILRYGLFQYSLLNQYRKNLRCFAAPTYFTVGSSPRYNLFTSPTGRIIVHTATKYGTKTLLYVTFHFRYQRGLASLRHKNHAATTVLVCDEKSYRV